MALAKISVFCILNAELMLLFAMYCLNFFNIYAIDDGFFLVFRDASRVSFSKYNSSNSPFAIRGVSVQADDRLTWNV